MLFSAACSDSGDPEPPATATMAADEHDDDEDVHDEGSELADAAVDESITIELRDFEFAPASLEVTAGQIVEIAFSNTGVALHDFTIEEGDLDSMMMGEMQAVEGHEGNEHTAGFAMHVALEPEHDAMMRMRLHEPGEYVFYCTVPGHRDLGMEGTLTVN